MKILCIGAGAIGIAIGGSMAEQGADVAFLLKPGQDEQLAGKELIVQNQKNIKHISNYSLITDLSEGKSEEKIDCLVIAVKAFDTDRVIKQIKNSTLNFKAILCLQNGVENEDKFRTAFPNAAIIGASVVSAVSKIDVNQVRIEKNRGIGISGPDPLTGQLIDLLEKAGLKPRRYDDLKSMKWSKMISNLFSNATSGILDMTPKEIYTDKNLFRIEREQILESVRVMRALGLKCQNLPGLPLRPLIYFIEVLPNWILQPLLTKLVAGGRGEKMPSFYIEKMKGSNRSEVNYLNGVVARKASEIGELAPVNETLTKIFLEILQDKKVGAAYSRNPILFVETINKEKRICYDETKS